MVAGEKLPSDSNLSTIGPKDFDNFPSDATMAEANSASGSLPEGKDGQGMLDKVQEHVGPCTSVNAFDVKDEARKTGGDEEDEVEEVEDDELGSIVDAAEAFDEKLRLLAMIPWIRAYGEVRAQEEQKLANVCYLT